MRTPEKKDLDLDDFMSQNHISHKWETCLLWFSHGIQSFTQVKLHPKSDLVEAAWLPDPTLFIGAQWEHNEGVSHSPGEGPSEKVIGELEL